MGDTEPKMIVCGLVATNRQGNVMDARMEFFVMWNGMCFSSGWLDTVGMFFSFFFVGSRFLASVWYYAWTEWTDKLKRWNALRAEMRKYKISLKHANAMLSRYVCTIYYAICICRTRDGFLHVPRFSSRTMQRIFYIIYESCHKGIYRTFIERERDARAFRCFGLRVLLSTFAWCVLSVPREMASRDHDAAADDNDRQIRFRMRAWPAFKSQNITESWRYVYNWEQFMCLCETFQHIVCIQCRVLLCVLRTLKSHTHERPKRLGTAKHCLFRVCVPERTE